MAMLTGGGLLLHRVGRCGYLSARNRALRGRSAFSAPKEALALLIPHPFLSTTPLSCSSQADGSCRVVSPRVDAADVAHEDSDVFVA